MQVREILGHVAINRAAVSMEQILLEGLNTFLRFFSCPTFEGAFGRVFNGVVLSTQNPSVRHPVMVKTVSGESLLLLSLPTRRVAETATQIQVDAMLRDACRLKVQASTLYFYRRNLGVSGRLAP